MEAPGLMQHSDLRSQKVFQIKQFSCKGFPLDFVHKILKIATKSQLIPSWDPPQAHKWKLFLNNSCPVFLFVKRNYIGPVHLGVLMLYWNSSGTARKLGARFCSRKANYAKFKQYVRHFWTFESSVSMKIKRWVFSLILERFKITIMTSDVQKSSK